MRLAQSHEKSKCPIVGGPCSRRLAIDCDVSRRLARRMPAAPEFARGPTLFFAVVFRASLTIAPEFLVYVTAISAQAGLVISVIPVTAVIPVNPVILVIPLVPGVPAILVSPLAPVVLAILVIPLAPVVLGILAAGFEVATS